MIETLVDAGACPVKDETYVVATRDGVPVRLVADSAIASKLDELVQRSLARRDVKPDVVTAVEATRTAQARPAIGLVGCGVWGRNILRDLRALGAIVFVADPCSESRERALALGAEAAVESPEALPDLDGLIVASPATTHARVIESLLARGVPVFAEKPLTTDVASARRLVELGRDLLFVMHVWRYHPGIALLSEIARSGEFGPVHGLRTVRTGWTSSRTDTDSIWTLAPHDLSIAIGVLGAIPPAHSAVAEILEGRPVGLVAILGDSPWFVIEVSNRYRGKRREVRLHCRDGVAVLPHGESDFLEIIRSSEEGDGPSVERRRIDPEPALARELRVFLEHLAGGPPPPTDAAEGLAVVAGVARLRALAGVSDLA